MELEPRPAWGYYGCATIYTEQGKYEEAIRSYDRAVELDPQFALAYGNRGLVRMQRGENGLAEKDFRRSILLDPTLKEELEERIRAVKQSRSGER